MMKLIPKSKAKAEELKDKYAKKFDEVKHGFKQITDQLAGLSQSIETMNTRIDVLASRLGLPLTKPSVIEPEHKEELGVETKTTPKGGRTH